MSTDPPDPGQQGAGDDRFHQFARTRDRALRNELVEEHMGLAYHFAARFRRLTCPMLRTTRIEQTMTRRGRRPAEKAAGANKPR